jgi:hypothetical protein
MPRRLPIFLAPILLIVLAGCSHQAARSSQLQDASAPSAAPTADYAAVLGCDHPLSPLPLSGSMSYIHYEAFSCADPATGFPNGVIYVFTSTGDEQLYIQQVHSASPGVGVVAGPGWVVTGSAAARASAINAGGQLA